MICEKRLRHKYEQIVEPDPWPGTKDCKDFEW